MAAAAPAATPVDKKKKKGGYMVFDLDDSPTPATVVRTPLAAPTPKAPPNTPAAQASETPASKAANTPKAKVPPSDANYFYFQQTAIWKATRG